MKVVIKFFRIRTPDGAHAIIGCETVDAIDQNDAVARATRLLDTLDMPQRPDGVTITDAAGTPFHSALFTRGRYTMDNDNHEHRDT
ncbi:hypothetical protein [Stappia sp. 28M-7]|jgi:hypothetical protein|uniref:hypothetical protein n=1 Tax=Stappia sp. 28M-7 TaxID=2762596 RepID=UPI00163B777A|nr:hypothetical protein [Stappia sp. 28M-7]MBC2860356.1 hypothetical protein [Stappia sp. 28M-7]